MQQLPLRTTKVKKNFSPPIKIGKTKHVLGKTTLGKIQEGGENKDTQTKLENKIKLRIHIKKTIISFNKCKLDTM